MDKQSPSFLEETQLENRKQEAIAAALHNSWNEAVKLNLEILKSTPKETETLNRLANAYKEIGMIGKAKSTYKEVLGLDPYNSIASKNLEKLSALTKSDLERAQRGGSQSVALSADLFLEEPGKTKVVELEDLAMGKILATMHTGDPVELVAHGQEVTATITGRRLGKFPPDLAARMAEALKNGSKFSAVVKAVIIKKSRKETSVNLFLRETIHSPKLGTAPFFPSSNNHNTSFIREDSLSLMDTREGLILDTSDDDMEPSSPSFQPHPEDETEDDHGPHHSSNEDDEDFENS